MRANTNAIVCRSIHEEKNGEFILVGVLAGAIEIQSDRFEQSFDLFMTVSDLPPGVYPAEFRLLSPSEKPSFARFMVSIQENSRGVNLQVSGVPFVTSSPGSFKLEWRIGSSKRWEKLLEIPISFSEDFDENILDYGDERVEE